MYEADSRRTTLKWHVGWPCKALTATKEARRVHIKGLPVQWGIRVLYKSTKVFCCFFLITIPGSGSAGTSFYSRKEVSLELWSCAAASARWWFATFPFPWCEVTPDKRGVSAAGDLVERSEAITTTYRSSPSSSSSRLSWTSAVTTEFSAACRLQEGDEWNKGSSAGSLSGSSSGKLVLM